MVRKGGQNIVPVERYRAGVRRRPDDHRRPAGGDRRSGRASWARLEPGRIVKDRSALDYIRVFVGKANMVGVPLAQLPMPAGFPTHLLHVRRYDMDIVPTPDLTLEFGDRVGVLMPPDRKEEIRRHFGDTVKATAEFSYVSLGIGMVLGVLLGLIPIPIPGVGTVTLGIGGGPLIVALIVGKLRRTGPLLWVMPLPANIVLRNFGLAMFLASVGINAGQPFVRTVSETGLTMLFIGAAVLLTTVLIVLLVGYYLMKIPYDDLVGVASGATGNPAILVYSTRMAPTERPDIGYAMIFPSMTIVKVIAVQIVGLLVAPARADRMTAFAAATARRTDEYSLHARAAIAPPQAVTFDAIMPADMAVRAEESGVRRASTDPLTVLVFSVLAGAFISFGAIFATTVSAGAHRRRWLASPDCPMGCRLLTGLVFSLGLILVVIGGAELFTGNNYDRDGLGERQGEDTRSLLLNWMLAFTGNFVGAIATAGLMFYTTQYTFGGGAVGLAALATANAQGVAGFRSGADARHHVQRVGVPGGVDVLQRAHERSTGSSPSFRRSRHSSPRASSTALPMSISSRWDCSSRPGRRNSFWAFDRQDGGGLIRP